MAFNLQTWREQCKAHLKNWQQRLADRKVDSIYGTIAAAAFWPVAAAFQQGDLSALFALGQAIGDVGANLLAGSLQSWRDQTTAARDFSERAEHEPALRDELDAIIEKLDALATAKAALPENEQAWFIEKLQEELRRLGNLEKFAAVLHGAGAIAQGAGAKALGEGAVMVEGNASGVFATGNLAVGADITGRDKTVIAGTDIIHSAGHVVIADKGATVVIGEAPVQMDAVNRESALGRYLEHVVARNRYLQLQGIRSGGRVVHIELEQIYIALRASQQRTVQAEEKWLAAEAALTPGEMRQRNLERLGQTTETVTVSVNEALGEHRRLVVLGDPGSGKTTLLRYLALLYGRDVAQANQVVKEKLGLDESGILPILLPLRQIGAFLQTRADDGTEGHALLLEFLHQSLKNERIELPQDFFDSYFQAGRAVVLLDGLDEVADADLRRRVARLVEAFTRAYSQCRFVVTSRIVGYAGAARLSENYVTTTVRDFTLAEVERFLNYWHRLVAIGQMGAGSSAEAYAETQTRQLLAAIRRNERIRELAINPLMLTVIALVHRDRVKLPDRRAELYAEAVDVLLGKWEEAKGVREIPILADKPFDTGDKRLMLQSLALRLHENQQKEIEVGNLRQWLGDMFIEILGEAREAELAVNRFLHVIEERTGLLAARGEGIYAFSHLTFQEYLAALAIAARDDYVDYALKRIPDPWWREVILLEAGYLSTQSKERTTRLIRAIAEQKTEPEPYHNLVLAAECLRDVGTSRVQGDLESEVQGKLRNELDTPPPRGPLKSFQLLITKGTTAKALTGRRSAAATALSRIGGITHWTLPHGEPDWVEIPAGEFWMGSARGASDEQPQHELYLEKFFISRVPVTNAQYQLFVQFTGRTSPKHWVDERPPKGKESHPVVYVSWYDALAYCEWLSKMTGQTVTLPSEAEWEKAARGDKDKREYPWGETFEATRCNSEELGLGDTTPVGIFPSGASPYGVLDMSGNVWEWTRSLWGDYPYPADEKGRTERENLEASRDTARVWRGGAFYVNDGRVRCAYRYWYSPDYWVNYLGFRVAALPLL